MRRHIGLFQQPKEPLRDFVIDDAFLDDGPALLRVERRRIILEVLDDLIRLVGRKDFLGLYLRRVVRLLSYLCLTCNHIHWANTSMISSNDLTVPSKVG